MKNTIFIIALLISTVSCCSAEMFFFPNMVKVEAHSFGFTDSAGQKQWQDVALFSNGSDVVATFHTSPADPESFWLAASPIIRGWVAEHQDVRIVTCYSARHTDAFVTSRLLFVADEVACSGKHYEDGVDSYYFGPQSVVFGN